MSHKEDKSRDKVGNNMNITKSIMLLVVLTIVLGGFVYDYQEVSDLALAEVTQTTLRWTWITPDREYFVKNIVTVKETVSGNVVLSEEKAPGANENVNVLLTGLKTGTSYTITIQSVYNEPSGSEDAEYSLIYYRDTDPNNVNPSEKGYKLLDQVMSVDGVVVFSGYQFIGEDIPMSGDVNVRGKIWIVPTSELNSDGTLKWTGNGIGNTMTDGNIISDEPFVNIESTCRTEKDLQYDNPTIYTFKCMIYEVILSGTQNEASVMIRTDNLVGRSNKTPIQPEGEVYKFANIYVGTKRFGNAELRFKVPVSWTQNKNIQMLRWKDNAWVALETTKVTEDSEFVYFSAVTDHFSNFAIVGKQVSSPTSQPQIVPATATTPISIETLITPEMTKESPGFSVLVMIFAIFGVVYMIRRKK